MKNPFLAVMAVVVFLVGALASTALAQEDAPEFETPPEDVLVEDLVDEYVEVLPLVAVTEEQPPGDVEPEVEVLGVAEERLPVTGSDLLGLALIGLALTTLGFLAVRRSPGAANIG